MRWRDEGYVKPATKVFSISPETEKAFSVVSLANYHTVTKYRIGAWRNKDPGAKPPAKIETSPPGSRDSIFITWGKMPSLSTVRGLSGTRGEVTIDGDLLSWKKMMVASRSDSAFEWKGEWGSQMKLVDLRVPQPTSLEPAVLAVYTPPDKPGEDATLEVREDVLAMEHFMDHVIVSILWGQFEYKYHKMLKSKWWE